MVGFLTEDVLRIAGLDDNDIALLNKELPDLENLITVFQQHQAQLNRVLALLSLVKKVLNKQKGLTL